MQSISTGQTRVCLPGARLRGAFGLKLSRCKGSETGNCVNHVEGGGLHGGATQSSHYGVGREEIEVCGEKQMRTKSRPLWVSRPSERTWSCSGMQSPC